MPRDLTLTDEDRRKRNTAMWLLRYAHGCTLADIAAAFGFDVGTTTMIIRRVGRAMERAATIRPLAPAPWWNRLENAGALVAPIPRGQRDTAHGRQARDHWINPPRFVVEKCGTTIARVYKRRGSL